jgi:hypothetical protein
MKAKIRKLLDELAALLKKQDPGAVDRAIESIKSEKSRRDGETWKN